MDLLGDMDWLTVGDPVLPTGVGVGWVQGTKQASQVLLHKTVKTISLLSWIYAGIAMLNTMLTQNWRLSAAHFTFPGGNGRIYITISQLLFFSEQQKIIEGYVVESACGAYATLSTSEHCKTELFFPCLDFILSKLEWQFIGINAKIMSGFKPAAQTLTTFCLKSALMKLQNITTYS